MSSLPTEPITAVRPQRRVLIDTVFLLVALSALFIVTNPSPEVGDPDIWLHLRTGQLILAKHAVPVVDTLSSRAAGHEWIAYSWLFDVLVYEIYSAWGYNGLLILALAGALASTAWLIVFLAQYTKLPRAMIVAFLAALATVPLRTPRPWMFTVLFFTIEMSLLWMARERNRPAWLLPIVPLFAIWANLHIQFVYGIGLLGLFALDSSLPDAARRALSAEPRPALRSVWLWALLGASCLATFLNPYGWNLCRTIFEYATQNSPMIYIQEYQAMPFRAPWNWIGFALVCAAIFVLGCARGKSLVLIAALAAACFFGFRSQRDIWFPVTVAALILATGIPKSEDFVSSRCRYAIAIPLSFALALGFIAFDSRFSNAALLPKIEERFPVKACSYVESHGLQGPLFNSYSWGDYIIWRLPGMPVSIDGRSNFYESTLAAAANTVTGQKSWSQDPALRAARTIIIEQDFALTSILRVDPAYRLLYEDKTAAVFQPVNAPAQR